MKNKIRYILGTLIILILLGGGIFLYCQNNKDKELTDALKFKEEYESLNGAKRDTGDIYQTITIKEDNPIKYISVKEAVEIVKNKTGIIYFGANWCPWCRNAITVLLSVAKEEKLETIYYLDMTEVRNTWKVEDGKLVKTQKEQEGYYELLELLDSILGEDTYKISDDNFTYDTSEKRIYLPMIVAVKNGKIMGNHVGTVSLIEGQSKYDLLKKNQIQELSKIYKNLINETNTSNVCSSNELCD